MKKSSARAARARARVGPRGSLDESTDSPAVPHGPTPTRSRTSQTEHFFNSLLGGERVDLSLLGDPADAGRTYALLLGASGSTPPTRLGTTQVPLVFDAATSLGIALLGTQVLPGSIGQLDAEGRASAAVVLPAALDAALVGSELTLAWILTAPIDTASDPLTVVITP